MTDDACFRALYDPPLGKPVTDSEALYQFRLLEALRSGEIAKLQPFLNDLTRSAGVGEEDKGAAMLNRAVKCASCQSSLSLA